MRRKDREMDVEFAKTVIDKSRFGVLSIHNSADSRPYSVPLSIVRFENSLYFHSATEGMKVELLAQSNEARVVFVGDVHVPDLYTKNQLDQMTHDKDQTAKLISSVFTTEYESAIVEGKVYDVTEEYEKIIALKLICEKYTPDKMAYFEYAVQAGLHRTRIFRLEIDEITAKRKKY